MSSLISTTTLADDRAYALRSLTPPPRLQLSAWIENNIILPEAVSALPGKVRLWPYQREIADAISDPMIERVTLVKGVRLGFTTLLTGAIGAYVANEPASILCLLPTDSDTRDYVVSELEPIFAATPALCDALAADTDEGGRNTLTSKRFAGGSLRVIAARAPRNLRRVTARILLVDEADAMEVTAEGNPVRLAERRTLSYSNRKIVIGSTPLDRTPRTSYAPMPKAMAASSRCRVLSAAAALRSHGSTSSGKTGSRRRRVSGVRIARRLYPNGTRRAWSPPVAGARPGPRSEAMPVSG